MADESHDRITHIDLLNLWHDDTNLLRDEIRNEMRGLIGVGFALMLLFMAFVTSVR